MKPQAFAFFSGRLHHAWKSGSGISLHILPGGLQLPVCVFSWYIVNTGIKYVLFPPSNYRSLLHSASCLNIWEMVVKFLGITEVLLIVQGREDAAAR